MTLSTTPDVIDQLAGIEQGGNSDALRSRRPQARQQAQQSYLALFEPAAPSSGGEQTFTAVERFAVAAFVAGLHGQPGITAFYADGLGHRGAPASLRDAVAAQAAAGLTPGPYGRYPAGPLSGEDIPGPVYTVSGPGRSALGTRLSAGLAHAHLLVLHPRDAQAGALQALLDADWSTTDIVTLSQLVAFLSFQIRLVVGLRALAAHPQPSPTA